MKWNLILLGWGSLALLVVQLAQSARSADESKPERAPCNVALVDVSYLFKHCDSFNAALEALKSEVALKDAEVAQEKLKIESREKAIQDLTDPEELKEEQASILRDKTEFNIKTTTLRNGYLEREKQIYLEQYERLHSMVSKYAQAHGFRLVLRSSQFESVKSATREDVLKKINDPIVFQDQIDITSDILLQLNQKDATGTQ
jgi:Skp family chaperone for outer membrane proteins